MSSREQKRRLLWRVAQICVPDFDNDEDYLSYSLFRPDSCVKAINELNKMDGHHSPHKIDMSRSDPDVENGNNAALEYVDIYDKKQ